MIAHCSCPTCRRWRRDPSAHANDAALVADHNRRCRAGGAHGSDIAADRRSFAAAGLAFDADPTRAEIEDELGELPEPFDVKFEGRPLAAFIDYLGEHLDATELAAFRELLNAHAGKYSVNEFMPIVRDWLREHLPSAEYDSLDGRLGYGQDFVTDLGSVFMDLAHDGTTRGNKMYANDAQIIRAMNGFRDAQRATAVLGLPATGDDTLAVCRGALAQLGFDQQTLDRLDARSGLAIIRQLALRRAGGFANDAAGAASAERWISRTMAQDADPRNPEGDRDEREDQPKDVFLDQVRRKFPVKTKRGGVWRFDNDLLRAAERDAAKEHNYEIEEAAKRIRRNHFSEHGGAHDGIVGIPAGLHHANDSASCGSSEAWFSKITGLPR